MWESMDIPQRHSGPNGSGNGVLDGPSQELSGTVDFFFSEEQGLDPARAVGPPSATMSVGAVFGRQEPSRYPARVYLRCLSRRLSRGGAGRTRVPLVPMKVQGSPS